MAPKAEASTLVQLEGREVAITHPDRVIFARLGVTKLDLVQYYARVGAALMRRLRDRPMLLKRYPRGASVEPFYQQHAPAGRPDWVPTALTHFGGGGTAEQVVCSELAVVGWAVNLGCIELHPWAVTTADLDHPDELRVDLDPGNASDWNDVREVAFVTRQALADVGLVGFAKTSGSRGIHIQVPIWPRWEFMQVRRAAIALAREVERRAPAIATSAWWKEERGGRVLLDYNQNARGRTTAAAYSVRAVPDARVSCPVSWDELAEVDPAACTIATLPERLAALGDPLAEMEQQRAGLDGLLAWVERDAGQGLGDAPWPPHFSRVAGEPIRAAPSRRRGRLRGVKPPPPVPLPRSSGEGE